jgi:hypothetical protein
MLDQALAKLVTRDIPSLDGIEAAIWEREAQRTSSRAATRKLVSWQAAIMLIAIFSSASLGVSVAAQSPPQSSGVLSLHSGSTPSARLYGHRP